MEQIDNEKLISEIKKYKLLYERNSTQYRNKFKRAKAWTEVSAAMKLNVTICQTRWKNIRDRYVKIFQKNLLCGSGSVKPESSWSLMQHLDFLSEHIQPRKTVLCAPKVEFSVSEDSNSFSQIDESSQSMDDSPCSAPIEDSYCTPSSSRKRKTEQDHDDPLLVTKFTKYTERRQPVTNKHDGFFKLLEQKFQDRDDPLTKKMCELVTQFTKNIERRQPVANKHEPFFKLLEQKFQDIPEQHLEEIKLNMINYVFNYAKRLQHQENIKNLTLDL